MKTIHPRRSFIKQLTASVGATALLPFALRAADAPAHVEVTDPTAMALGYVKDTTKADAKKYPQHKPDQTCSGCALYTGKADAADGPCTAFGNKRVTANGWCMAFVKRP